MRFHLEIFLEKMIKNNWLMIGRNESCIGAIIIKKAKSKVLINKHNFIVSCIGVA